MHPDFACIDFPNYSAIQMNVDVCRYLGVVYVNDILVFFWQTTSSYLEFYWSIGGHKVYIYIKKLIIPNFHVVNI